MSKRNRLAAIVATLAAATAGAALAQTPDTLSVYVGNLPDLDVSGDTEAVVEVPLPVASEACGVDLKFIEAWAASGSRYCVALHPVDDRQLSRVEQAISNRKLHLRRHAAMRPENIPVPLGI